MSREGRNGPGREEEREGAEREREGRGREEGWTEERSRQGLRRDRVERWKGKEVRECQKRGGTGGRDEEAKGRAEAEVTACQTRVPLGGIYGRWGIGQTCDFQRSFFRNAPCYLLDTQRDVPLVLFPVPANLTLTEHARAIPPLVHPVGLSALVAGVDGPQFVQPFGGLGKRLLAVLECVHCALISHYRFFLLSQSQATPCAAMKISMIRPMMPKAIARTRALSGSMSP
jgi:hypothetical protein